MGRLCWPPSPDDRRALLHRKQLLLLQRPNADSAAAIGVAAYASHVAGTTGKVDAAAGSATGTTCWY